MTNALNLDLNFVNEIAENLQKNGHKEVKSKVKMGAWLVRQNAKHSDLEDHLQSDIYEYNVKKDGIVIRKSCVFIAIDTRDKTLLFANLLTHKFGLKLHKELKSKREAKQHQLKIRKRMTPASKFHQLRKLSIGQQCFAIPTGSSSILWTNLKCSDYKPFVELEVEAMSDSSIVFCDLTPIFIFDDSPELKSQPFLRLTSLNRITEAGLKLFLSHDELLQYLNGSRNQA